MSIKHLNAEQLRQFIQSHHENNYLLLDVRQPEEYRRGHIPGARLLPLPELAKSVDQLPKDRQLIFYCHVGGRSMAAAAMAEEESTGLVISNLTGGMLAWDGARLADHPQVRLFAGQSRVEMFNTAMDLEKGAQRFYEIVHSDHAGQPWAPVFGRLAKAEVAHARTVYGFKQREDKNLEPFEAVYDRLPGEILEGGMTLQSALQQSADWPAGDCRPWIEMALQIEYAAYELYRVIGDQADLAAESRQAFISLAQAEKAHMRILIDALDQCTR